MNDQDASVRIDLASLTYNFNVARAAAPTSQIMAVIKADAYGHGAEAVAKHLGTADAFAVARISEAVVLRESGINHPITVLSGLIDQHGVRLAERYGIDLVLHHPEQLGLFQSSGVNVWLKFDTGMHRLGLGLKDLEGCLKALPEARVLGLVSHFSDADDPSNAKNNEQLETFLAQIQRFGLPGSLSNSAAILSGLGTDQAWVRPGIMLYGANPFVSRSVDLRPVMELTAPVIAVKQLRRGDRVGYGSRWQAQADCTVAVLAIGYADGYPREIKLDTPVGLNGQRETVLGRISMDMLTISVSGAPPSIGDRAELWGQHVAIEEVAAQAGTLSYVLMCGLAARVPRIYQE